MSETPFPSDKRLLASDQNATKRPSPLIEGPKLGPSGAAPPATTDAFRSVSACTSKTKMSLYSSFVSPGIRLVASELKATNRPSALTAGDPDRPLEGVPLTPL